MENKTYSTISHIFKPKRDSAQYYMLQDLLLEEFSKTRGESKKPVLTQLSNFQTVFRYQLYRYITKYPENRHSLTYVLNCRPPGVEVSPYTIACQNRRVCPWCFVRRLHRVYCDLVKVPTQIQNRSRLLVWKRLVPMRHETDPLPMFGRSNFDVHVKAKAYHTTQFALPFIAGPLDTNTFCWHHVGFQLVPLDFEPKDFFLHKHLFKLPHISTHLFREDFSEKLVLKAISSSCRLDWNSLLAKSNFEQFDRLFDAYPKKRFVRTSKTYNKKED